MQSFAVLAVLLTAPCARCDDFTLTFTGKVVAVLDDRTLAVYFDEVRATYQISLAGVEVSGLNPRLAAEARELLARLLLGREVELDVERLSLEGQVPAEVFLEGRSVNEELRSMLRTAAGPAETASARPGCRWRPRVLLAATLRMIPLAASRATRIGRDP